MTRIGRASSIVLVGALALTGCGSDDNSGNNGGGGGGGEASKSDGGSGGGGGGDAECGEGSLKGEGSSAQKNAIDEVNSAFQGQCSGLKVDYNSTGSGNGIKQFIAGQVQFAGSDSALKTEPKDGVIQQKAADKTCGSPAWNIPMVTGPIAVAYNLKGVDKLVLTPDVIAEIFQGKITSWDDKKIADLNKGAKLPSTKIQVFFRSDESGTTENFTKYLNKSSKVWKDEPDKKWTGKGQGKAKTDGVASAVKATDGGITYAEWSAAQDNKLGIAQVDNGAGPVELTGETAGKAVDSAKVDGKGNDLKLKLDYKTKTKGAYPIVLVTYEIVCSKYKDPKVAKNVKSFLSYFASDDAQKSIEEIGYAPLPEKISGKVKTAISAIK